MRDGITSEERDRIKALERENKELRRANEILALVSAFYWRQLADTVVTSVALA